MGEAAKVSSSHRSRAAAIYVRQSTLAQVERNTESTARQYDLAARARHLGWPPHLVRVVDGDLGVSGSVTGQRDAFEGMVAEVALGQVGSQWPTSASCCHSNVSDSSVSKSHAARSP